MTLRIGEVDVVAQILENEYRILVLEQVVDVLLQRLSSAGAWISPEEMGGIRERAIENLKKKYPGSGIQLKEEEKDV